MKNRKWLQPNHEPYYNANHLLDKYGVVISIGSRGKGKTLSWKLNAIYNTLNFGKETIYLRRFKTELKESKTKFLGDLYEGDKRLENEKIEIKGNTLYVNDKPSIHFVALSTSLNLKSVSYHNVNMLIFDEFLTLGYKLRGVNEETIFLEFLETTFRTRDDIFIVLLSNAISTTSKYYEIFGFDKPINPKRKYQYPKHSKDVVLEIINDDEDFKKLKEQSRLYKLLPPSQYKKYSIENEFIFEDNSNILKRKDIKGHINYLYTIATSEGYLDIYLFDKVKYYIMFNSKIERELIFTFDKDLTINGYIYINQSHDIPRRISTALAIKTLFFQDMKSKKIFIENLKKIITTYY